MRDCGSPAPGLATARTARVARGQRPARIMQPSMTESAPPHPLPTAPRTAPLRITFPESLPVSGKREEIMEAIKKHQVIIVCGETGSGKTTQLPKIALALGRGKCNARPGTKGQLIGHTQPRRIAASSVAKRPAPVIMVSGRTFPVEQRYRPFEESRDYGLNEAIADGVDELWQGNAAGDILVFLPGEREIREAADHLRKHLSHQPVMRNAEVLPLFARLSQAEQDRIFDGHTGRRIVLATNVAETSLTVPGVRYVIDAGTARVKRYSFRSKVEQLLVEPVSQAAANQRAGRCGRVANGICIRLYDEAGFNGRPRFTDPAILRSSLAGVILRMKSLHLGDVTQFPFIEAPSGRAIADGYQLLAELGAVDDANELTPMGVELSRLPLDPRVGRMIFEARDRKALDEVLVIASALSVQDVRDRP